MNTFSGKKAVPPSPLSEDSYRSLMSPWTDDFYGHGHMPFVTAQTERTGLMSMLLMGFNCLRYLDVPRVNPAQSGQEYWASIWMALGKDGQRVIGAFESAIESHSVGRDALDA